MITRKLLTYFCWIATFLMAILCFTGFADCAASAIEGEASSNFSVRGRIIYIPIDNRPITDQYTVDTMVKAGYTVIVPPDELLGGYGHMQGDADQVWEWLDNAIHEYGHIDGAVISTDTLIYGSLVGSRIHELMQDALLQRVARFKELKQQHPGLNLYLFSSIMRTPHYNATFGGAECAYMDNYAALISQYSLLKDKQETIGLKKKEEQELQSVRSQIPDEVFNDWQARRDKNYAVNQELLNLVQQGIANYFVMGHDDNAELSQTHREARKLENYAEAQLQLNSVQYGSMDGIDEIGMLLLARAGNDKNHVIPFVFAAYNEGQGGNMLPAFGSKPLDDTMKAYIRCAGGFYTHFLNRADSVMVVNTPEGGPGIFAGSEANSLLPDATDYQAVAKLEKYFSLDKKILIGLVDVSTYNGSDNGLLQLLQNNHELFSLSVYGGWNTASNSLGFALGQCMQIPYMTEEQKNQLLMTRYLDDWAYEAHIRQQLGNYVQELTSVAQVNNELPADGNIIAYKKNDIENYATGLLRTFAQERLSSYPEADAGHKFEFIKMELPWSRLFENRVVMEQRPY